MHTAQSLIAATLPTNPTADRMRKSNGGKGTWEQKSSWDLPESHRVNVYTYKNSRGHLITTASVCTYENYEGGGSSEQFVCGIGAEGDLMETWTTTDSRCTEKAVREQHAQAIEAHFKAFLDRLVAKYGSAMKLGGAQRTLREVAREIRQVWPKPYFGAVPYLEAMSCVDTVNSRYGMEDGKTQVIYFLSNASTWRGEDAKRIKAELKNLAGIK